MILLIICISLFAISLIIAITCCFMDWHEGLFTASIILLLLSGIGLVVSAVYSKPDIKPIEYPASEYTFKIKVVEFEEQRDTILVVTPKDK